MTSSEPKQAFLKRDDPIPGQNWCCLSFISPEKIIKQRETYFMNHFLLDLIKDEKKRKYLEKIEADKLDYQKVADMIEDFRIVHEERIGNLFTEEVTNHTSLRAVKVRGIYDTEAEARDMIKQLHNKDPLFNIFLGRVGAWLPWDPSNFDKLDQVYDNENLNALAHEYKKNAQERDLFFEEEKNNKIRKANEETMKQKKKMVETGELKTMQEPTNTMTDDKIKEFRDIVDEKDKKFNDFMKQKREQKEQKEQSANSIPNQLENKPKSDDVLRNQLTDDPSIKVINKARKRRVTGTDEENDQFGTDPWLQNKEKGKDDVQVEPFSISSTIQQGLAEMADYDACVNDSCKEHNHSHTSHTVKAVQSEKADKTEKKAKTPRKKEEKPKQTSEEEKPVKKAVRKKKEVVEKNLETVSKNIF